MQWWRKPIEIPRNACKCARIKINDMFSWIILVAVPGIVLEVPSGGIRACYLSRRVLQYQNVIRPIQNDLSMSSHYWTMLPLKSKKGTIKQVLPISLPMSTIIKMRVFVSTNPCPYPIKFHSTATVSLERPRLNKGIRAEKMFLAGFSQGPLVEHEWFTRGGVANVGEPEETTYRGSQGVWLLIVGRCWEKWLSKDVKPYLHLGFDHVRPICWSQLHVIPVEIVWLDVYIYNIWLQGLYLVSPGSYLYTHALLVALDNDLGLDALAWWTHPVRHQPFSQVLSFQVALYRFTRAYLWTTHWLA